MQRVAVLLAGGKSSRMGEDKALLPFGRYSSLAEYQYRRLLGFFDRIYISSKTDKFDFDVDLILDCYEASSPLVALVSIFESLEVDEIFLLSVDAPFVERYVVDRLYQEADVLDDVIVAKSPVGIEPLCAIYRRSILAQAKIFLEEDNHRLKALLATLHTKEVFFERVESFFNLNHPHEYQKAYRLSSNI